MSVRDLIECECGAANSLSKLASHFVQDRGLTEEGLGHTLHHPANDLSPCGSDQLVQEYLGETLGPSPQTFHMDSLLEEMREMELTGPVQGPGVAALAASDPSVCQSEDLAWADQFVQAGRQVEVVKKGDEIWATEAPDLSFPAPEVYEYGFRPNWAAKYLQSSETPSEISDEWINPIKASDGEGNELRETATAFLSHRFARDYRFARSKMSVRDLIEGECGAANSLSKLASHFVQDRGLTEEGLRHTFHHPANDLSNCGSDQLVQEYLGETMGPSPQTFHMDSLLEEMREMELSGPVQGPGVAALAASDPSVCQSEDLAWADQFVQAGKQFEVVKKGDEIWATEAPDLSLPAPEVYEFGFGPNWAAEYLQSSETPSEVSDEWINPIKASDGEGNELRETATAFLSQPVARDPRFAHSKFMKFMGKISDGEVFINNGVVQVDVDDDGDIDTLSEELARQNVSNPDSETITDEEEAKTSNDMENLKQRTKEIIETLSDVYHGTQWSPDSVLHGGNIDDIDPNLKDYLTSLDVFKDYVFELQSPMKDNVNALEEGHKLRAAGDLAGAVLCYESAVQQDPDNAELWLHLGKAHQENEQDPSAISALRKALSLDPTNLTCLMALAVSYTNESFQSLACESLKEWLRCNPKYSHLVPEGTSIIDNHIFGPAYSLLSNENCEMVKKMFIAAARLNPSNTIDADVQCGLGVLFNLSNEMDKAVDCFRAALTANPKDHEMWNRLGASLANGNRSEEAVEAYRHALELSPGFVRARYNLGITCINLRAHKEAAEHLLIALNQQAARDQSLVPMSSTIWGTLRLVLAMLNRQDLYPATEKRDLQALNKEFNVE